MIAPPVEPAPRYLDIVEAPPAAEPPPPPVISGASGGAWAQLGAFRSRRRADEVLRSWRGRRPEAPLRVRAIRLPGGTWFRVIAGPLHGPGARDLCRTARAAGEPCWLRGDAD